MFRFRTQKSVQKLNKKLELGQKLNVLRTELVRISDADCTIKTETTSMIAAFKTTTTFTTAFKTTTTFTTAATYYVGVLGQVPPAQPS